MKRTEISPERVLEDLERRTLAHIRGDLSRLVYVASTRDYNTGEYHHDGLESTFSATAAREALARAHDRVFRSLLCESLAEIVQELKCYLESAGDDQGRMLKAWTDLEAYRVLIPAACHPLERSLFISNLMLALRIVGISPSPHC